MCVCVFDKLDLNCAYALKLDYNIMLYKVLCFTKINKILDTNLFHIATYKYSSSNWQPKVNIS